MTPKQTGGGESQSDILENDEKDVIANADGETTINIWGLPGTSRINSRISMRYTTTSGETTSTSFLWDLSIVVKTGTEVTLTSPEAFYRTTASERTVESVFGVYAWGKYNEGDYGLYTAETASEDRVFTFVAEGDVIDITVILGDHDSIYSGSTSLTDGVQVSACAINSVGNISYGGGGTFTIRYKDYAGDWTTEQHTAGSQTIVRYVRMGSNTITITPNSGYEFVGWFDFPLSGSWPYPLSENMDRFITSSRTIRSIYPDVGNGREILYAVFKASSTSLSNFTTINYSFATSTNTNILLSSEDLDISMTIGYDAPQALLYLPSNSQSCTLTISTANQKTEYQISFNGMTSTNTLTTTLTLERGKTYVIYVSQSYTISFNSNGGNGNMASVEVEPNASVTLPKCTFTRTGYEFAGWALSPTGVVMYSDGQTITPTASMTLYAIWRVGVYEITLNWNGGSGTWDKIYYKAGAGFYDSENCTILVSAGALIVRAERAGYSFSSFTTNANGTGTIMFQNETYMNSSTIVADDVWYAQWTVNNEAKYDSAGGYWYIENGKIPQTKVTNSTLITNLNKATTNGGNYYIAGEPLTAKVYNGTEYCKWNNNWYEVEPIRWRLTKDSNQSNGYGTETDTNAVLDKIVFVGQFSTTALGSGKGYSEDSVEEFMKNDIDTTYMIRTTKFVDTFGTGASLYGNQQFRTNFMFVSSQSEIEAVNGDLTITFSGLVKDMIKYYGGTNSYFTRDLGSNYNNITCINAVGKETQCFATNFRGLQFTVRFTEYGCVN